MLDKMPKRLQLEAKGKMHGICLAPTMELALVASRVFIPLYGTGLATLAMVFKLAHEAQNTRGLLQGQIKGNRLIPVVFEGTTCMN